MAAIRSSLLIALTVAACGTEPTAAPDSEAVIAGHCQARRFEGSDFTVCRYDSREHELVLFLDEGNAPLRSFARLEPRLGARRERLLFAMNAGMYDSGGRPIGLYIEDGRQRRELNLAEGPGNFHLKPNGVLAVAADGTVAIVRSEEWRRSGRRARWATQSGPLLVSGGEVHPRIRPHGDSLYVRNGVCTADAGAAWFAISEQPVSFGRFARFLRDGLGCRDALYLDGAVSSLWDPGAGRRDARSDLGPLVAVFARESGSD